MAQGASPRRLGAPHARNRAVLLDAAAQVMAENGYAAATSRRIASRAGLKPQLVHYYFATMDDLFIALLRRRADAGLEGLRRALEAPNPLRAIWEVDRHTWVDPLGLELIAIARHRASVGLELSGYAARFRAAMIEVIEQTPRPGTPLDDVLVPSVLAVLMTATSRTLAQEIDLGLTTGHAETVGLIEWYLDRIDGILAERASTPPIAGGRARA